MTETILWAHTWWGDETTDALIRRIQGAYECRLVPSPRDAREVLLLTGSKVKGTGGPFCERDPNVKVIAINLDTLILSEVTTITGVSDKNKWWLGWGGLAVPFDCGEGKTAILCAGGSGGPKTFPETLTSGAGSSLTVNSLINEPSLQTDDVLEELQCTNYMYDIVDGLAFRWGGSHASHHGISSPVDPGTIRVINLGSLLPTHSLFSVREAPIINGPVPPYDNTGTSGAFSGTMIAMSASQIFCFGVQRNNKASEITSSFYFFAGPGTNNSGSLRYVIHEYKMPTVKVHGTRYVLMSPKNQLNDVIVRAFGMNPTVAGMTTASGLLQSKIVDIHIDLTISPPKIWEKQRELIITSRDNRGYSLLDARLHGATFYDDVMKRTLIVGGCWGPCRFGTNSNGGRLHDVTIISRSRDRVFGGGGGSDPTTTAGGMAAGGGPTPGDGGPTTGGGVTGGGAPLTGGGETTGGGVSPADYWIGREAVLATKNITWMRLRLTQLINDNHKEKIKLRLTWKGQLLSTQNLVKAALREQILETEKAEPAAPAADAPVADTPAAVPAAAPAAAAAAAAPAAAPAAAAVADAPAAAPAAAAPAAAAPAAAAVAAAPAAAAVADTPAAAPAAAAVAAAAVAAAPAAAAVAAAPAAAVADAPVVAAAHKPKRKKSQKKSLPPAKRSKRRDQPVTALCDQTHTLDSSDKNSTWNREEINNESNRAYFYRTGGTIDYLWILIKKRDMPSEKFAEKKIKGSSFPIATIVYHKKPSHLL